MATQAEMEMEINEARVKPEMSSWLVKALIKDGVEVSAIPGMPDD